MDIVDRDLEKAETEASPERFNTSGQDFQHGGVPKKVERKGTTSTTSSSSSRFVVREEMAISRANTQRDLERHPTALSRIETHRTQHSGTVGRSITSRKSKKPLPNFGGGKDYPPPLPAQEEYVVEFDGPDDPMHPQNWPMRKKYVERNAAPAYLMNGREYSS